MVAGLWVVPVVIGVVQPDIDPTDGVLSHLLVSINPWTSLILGGVFVALQAFLLNRLFASSGLLSRETALPGAIFICCVSFDPGLAPIVSIFQFSTISKYFSQKNLENLTILGF